MTGSFGEIAALTTAMVWALSALINGLVAGKVGAASATLLRVPFQLFFVGLFCLIGGAVVTFDSGPLLTLFFSAVIGVALADLCFYRAFVLVGPRASILLQSLSVSCTALLGTVFLGEILGIQTVGGIVLATVGVGIVASSRNDGSAFPGASVDWRMKAIGIGLGLLSAVTLAAGYVFLRAGLQENIDPLWAAFVRLCMSGCVLWGLGLFGKWPQHAMADIIHSPTIVKMLVCSCFLGALGALGSCFALQKIEAGVAATLMGMQPVLAVIVVAFWERKLPSIRITAGTLAAFGGTALVCMR